MLGKILIYCVLAAAMLASPVSMAEQSVTINGVTYTCTNQCEVNVDPERDTLTVQDCCGGSVRVTFG